MNWDELEKAACNKLVGLAITGAFIDDTKDEIILTTDDGRFFEISHGEQCCEHVFFQHVNQIENIVGATITHAEPIEWQWYPENEDQACVGKGGFKLTTTKGYVSLETRMEGTDQYAGDLGVNDSIMPFPTDNTKHNCVGRYVDAQTDDMLSICCRWSNDQKWHYVVFKALREDF